MNDKTLKGGRTLISLHNKILKRTIYNLLSQSYYVLWEAYDLTDLCQQLEWFYNIEVPNVKHITPRMRFNALMKELQE